MGTFCGLFMFLITLITGRGDAFSGSNLIDQFGQHRTIVGLAPVTPRMIALNETLAAMRDPLTPANWTLAAVVPNLFYLLPVVFQAHPNGPSMADSHGTGLPSS